MIMAAAMLAACSKDDAEEIIGTSENATANSVLQVTTRAGGNDAIVAYPVQVYVFQGEECRAVQTIGDAGQTLNIPLVEGTYSVYAVGGASSTDYNLPTKDNATTTTALTLPACSRPWKPITLPRTRARISRRRNMRLPLLLRTRL